MVVSPICPSYPLYTIHSLLTLHPCNPTRPVNTFPTHTFYYIVEVAFHVNEGNVEREKQNASLTDCMLVRDGRVGSPCARLLTCTHVHVCSLALSLSYLSPSFSLTLQRCNHLHWWALYFSHRTTVGSVLLVGDTNLLTINALCRLSYHRRFYVAPC
jgi:hypothetical protein